MLGDGLLCNINRKQTVIILEIFATISKYIYIYIYIYKGESGLKLSNTRQIRNSLHMSLFKIQRRQDICNKGWILLTECSQWWMVMDLMLDSCILNMNHVFTSKISWINKTFNIKEPKTSIWVKKKPLILKSASSCLCTLL